MLRLLEGVLIGVIFGSTPGALVIIFESYPTTAKGTDLIPAATLSQQVVHQTLHALNSTKRNSVPATNGRLTRRDRDTSFAHSCLGARCTRGSKVLLPAHVKLLVWGICTNSGVW